MRPRLDLTEEDAVSPVIGVVLLVAITVILAISLGTLVFGIGDRMSDVSPNVQFDFRYMSADGGDTLLKVTHRSGVPVESSQLKVSVDGRTVWSGTDGPRGEYTTGQTWSGEVTAGDVLAIKGDFEKGQTVRLIWEAPSGRSAIIQETEVRLG